MSKESTQFELELLAIAQETSIQQICSLSSIGEANPYTDSFYKTYQRSPRQRTQRSYYT